MRQLRQFAAEQLAKQRLHYAGIALLNAAALARIGGDAPAALEDSSSAISALEQSSDGSEIAAARVTRAWALAHLCELEDARQELGLAVSDPRPWVRAESAIEASLTESWYGAAEQAQSFLSQAHVNLSRSGVDTIRALNLATAQLHLRTGEHSAALDLLDRTEMGSASAWPEMHVQRLALRAHASASLILPDAHRDLEAAQEAAGNQDAEFWVRYLDVVSTLGIGTAAFARTAEAIALIDASYLSICAELVAPRLWELGSQTLEVVRRQASLRMERWRVPLRTEAERPRSDNQMPAAELLFEIGEREDVLRLRRIGRTSRASRRATDLARLLARRLADRIYVEDQLRVTIHVGEHEITGSQVRRKVLALLCFLLSRPGYSATRDQVLDSLWPDLDPEIAVNSLNQTIYFLRRVFEPEYREDTSPGYLHHESDIVWLDSELIRSRCADSLEAVRKASEDPSVDRIEYLSETYRGKFALEFSYEEWAVPFRESLHASYLQLIESAVGIDMATGHHDRAIRLARRALEVDPDAEHVEVSLLRLYRVTGAHAAAAEQYEHYATVQRNDLGVEPPPLEAF